MEGLGTMNVRIGKKHLLGQYTIVLKTRYNQNTSSIYDFFLNNLHTTNFSVRL